MSDPYENFKFRVKWDGAYVAGISKVSMLHRQTDVVKHREGGDASVSLKSPGQSSWDPIWLERGISKDNAFETWANQVWNPQGGPGAESSPNFRKDVVLDIFNEAGQKVRSYLIHRCWVSEYMALPDLDASADAVAIERIKLEHEGWERDAAVVPP